MTQAELAIVAGANSTHPLFVARNTRFAGAPAAAENSGVPLRVFVGVDNVYHEETSRSIDRGGVAPAARGIRCFSAVVAH